MKKVKLFLDACKKLGKNPNVLPDVSMLDEKMQKFIIGLYKLAIIRDAIVDGWEADYENSSQRKWFAIFIYDSSSSSFRFNVAGYGRTAAFAGSGARLSFETEKQAIYFGKQFIDLHNEVLLNK